LRGGSMVHEPEPPSGDSTSTLSQGAGRKRRAKNNTIISTGLHGSQSARASQGGGQRSRPSPPRGGAPRGEPGSPRNGRGSTRQPTNREVLDGIETREREELPRADDVGNVVGAAEFGGFKHLDDVVGRLLRQNRVGDAVLYLQKLRGMVDEICEKLEPRADPGFGSTMSIGLTDQLPAITPRGAPKAVVRERVTAPPTRDYSNTLHASEENPEAVRSARDQVAVPLGHMPVMRALKLATPARAGVCGEGGGVCCVVRCCVSCALRLYTLNIRLGCSLGDSGVERAEISAAGGELAQATGGVAAEGRSDRGATGANQSAPDDGCAGEGSRGCNGVELRGAAAAVQAEREGCVRI